MKQHYRIQNRNPLNQAPANNEPQCPPPFSPTVLNIIASLAQMEAEVLSERTIAGLQARKAAGVQLGRPRKSGISNDALAEAAQGW